MLDERTLVRPRVALVYGDADAAGHLRDAVAAHVQIVYSTLAAEFDAARLADSRATAALLNLDSCEWLDAVETRLHAAGVAVVYNDPEISRALQGWEQARWLRHLTAKLSGSTDYDPPRPVAAEPPSAPEALVPVAEAAPVIAAAAEPTPVPTAAKSLAAVPTDVMEQPLSLAEIASMTVNFNAVLEPELARVDPPQVAEAEVVATSSVEPTVTVSAPDVSVAQPEGESPLDVDTEALSALIDARLAAAEDHAADDAPQVWRVAHGGAVSAVDLSSAAEPANADQDAPVVGVSPPPLDDSELMQGLPAIDDWQLVDRDAPVVPAAQPTRNEPAFSIDFADLELVPMEPVIQVAVHTESSERWMHVGSDDARAADEHQQPVTPDANGGRA